MIKKELYWHLYSDSQSKTFKNRPKQITFVKKSVVSEFGMSQKFGQWDKNKDVVSDLFTCQKKKCKFTLFSFHDSHSFSLKGSLGGI